MGRVWTGGLELGRADPDRPALVGSRAPLIDRSDLIDLSTGPKGPPLNPYSLHALSPSWRPSQARSASLLGLSPGTRIRFEYIVFTGRSLP